MTDKSKKMSRTSQMHAEIARLDERLVQLACTATEPDESMAHARWRAQIEASTGRLAHVTARIKRRFARYAARSRGEMV